MKTQPEVREMRAFWAVAALALATFPAHAQSMTAREMYYGENLRDEVKAKPRPPRKAPAKPKAPDVADSAPAVTPPAKAEEVVAQTPVQQAQLVTEKLRPLGLRYTIEQRDSGRRWNPVDQSQTFTKGDAVRLVIESNDPGYLYVVSQGSSNKWESKYPPSDKSDNRVQPGKRYTVPKTAFVFDEQQGTEKLFVILSRQPLDPENLIYSLDDKQRRPENPGALLAANLGSLQDDQVQQLRKMYSRDLLIEDESKAEPAPEVARPPEKAVYVVNQKADANARVVADISLHHE